MFQNYAKTCRSMLTLYPLLEAGSQLRRLAETDPGIHPFGAVVRAQRLAALREPLARGPWSAPVRRDTQAPPEAA